MGDSAFLRRFNTDGGSDSTFGTAGLVTTSIATAAYDDWIARASSSGVRMLQQFAQTLQSHRHGLLNYYDCPITTAALEGTNNKIKTLQRQTYGLRDREFFKLRIYALHESRYALVV